MTAPLVFMDTETTGLSLDDDIWEFAGIRRDPDGTETELHLFIEHDEHKCRQLPKSFRDDHERRYDPKAAVDARSAAHHIYDFLYPDDGTRVHVVGAVPNFDTERLSRLLRSEVGEHTRDPWHYHLIDVENLAVGYLAAMSARGGWPSAPVPPWDSDDLSRAVGVEPPTTKRHTAMGDARWAMAIYDRVMGACS